MYRKAHTSDSLAKHAFLGEKNLPSSPLKVHLKVREKERALLTDNGPRKVIPFQTTCQMYRARTIGPYTPLTSRTISTLHTPDADGLVVAGRCHHIRVARVPRNSVDGARVARKHLRAPWTRLSSGLRLPKGTWTITNCSRTGGWRPVHTSSNVALWRCQT